MGVCVSLNGSDSSNGVLLEGISSHSSSGGLKISVVKNSLCRFFAFSEVLLAEETSFRAFLNKYKVMSIII